MLTVDEAILAVLSRARPLPSRVVPLAEALGLILAEAIVADVDLPPFDKALMDGYAVRSVDLAGPGERRFRVVEEIVAGRTPTRPLLEGEAARIMTGAPLPSGADAVVMIEKSRGVEDGDVVVLAGPVEAGTARLPRGREMGAGEILLRPGIRLNAARLGLIASAGRAEVWVIPRPTVAVVPTGDELVPIGRFPGPGQIRNTNGVTLAAMARGWGSPLVREKPIAPDDPDGLRRDLGPSIGPGEEGVDLLLISGGVSAGSRDLVPPTLLALGVDPVFHRVAVKPGKPLWFGQGPPRGDRPGVLVFGLPGNPASGVVGSLLFARPAFEALSGSIDPRPRLVSGRLASPFRHRGARPTYHPARLDADGRVDPLDWAGSADLRAVALADGFAAFPAGDRDFVAGEPVEFLPIG